MLKHVLVPLDESELSENALDYALSITASDGCITLLIAVQPPVVQMVNSGSQLLPVEYDDGNLYTSMMEHAQAYLEDKVLPVKRQIVRSDFRAVCGEPADIILKTAEELNVDAIVMSTHGRSGLSRWVFGSVTQKVLSAAHCPVMVVPNRGKENKAAAES